MYITTLPANESYFALSYRWPSEMYDTLTLALKRDFEIPGGLKRARLALTVADAITATTDIGWRYIWVDSEEYQMC